MKYKVGDKVRVHSKEWFRTNCSKNYIGVFVHEDGNNTFVSGMEKFCEQEVTIKQTVLDNYNILEDEGQWYWEDWMFEDVNNNKNTISNPNIVEDFAKLIGVELDEEFYDKDSSFRYKITSTHGVMFYNTNTELWQVCTEYCINTFFKMIKEGKFSKKWTPKDGDIIFYPSFYTDNLWEYKIYNGNEHDKEMLKSGLYFRTQEEAVECAKKIIKNMKEG